MRISAIWRHAFAIIRPPRDGERKPSPARDSAVSLDTKLDPFKAAALRPCQPAQGPRPEPLRPLGQRRKDLHNAIQLIGNAPLSKDKVAEAMKTLVLLLQDPVLAGEARLWRAICVRICDGDAFHEFKSILAADPSNRLALVNMVANCLTRYSTSDMYDEREGPDALACLQDYLKSHPQDAFAQLLEALLQVELFPQKLERDKREAALEITEKLYLMAPNYSPAISVMAILLYRSLLTESARDYAREAMRKDPFNFQAIGIARYLKIEEGLNCRDGIEHAPTALSNGSLESILCAAYFTQDPLAQDNFLSQLSGLDA